MWRCSTWIVASLHQLSFNKLKIVQENEANKTCFLFTLWLQAKVKIIEIGMKY